MASKRKPKALTASEMGRLGGLARAKSLTPKERSDAGRLAVEVRWRKHRKKERMEIDLITMLSRLARYGGR